MIFQILLSAALVCILVYSIAQLGTSPLVSIVAAVGAVGGGFFVWFPEHANAIAHWIGIGRGADLLMYCWVVISMAVALNLHFKLRRDRESLTALARAIAIAEAERELAPTEGARRLPKAPRR